MIGALLWVCGAMAGVLLVALFVGRFIKVGRGPQGGQRPGGEGS